MRTRNRVEIAGAVLGASVSDVALACKHDRARDPFGAVAESVDVVWFRLDHCHAVDVVSLAGADVGTLVLVVGYWHAGELWAERVTVYDQDTFTLAQDEGGER